MQRLQRMPIPRPSQARQMGWSSGFELDVQGAIVALDNPPFEPGGEPHYTLLVLEDSDAALTDRHFVWVLPDVSLPSDLALCYIGSADHFYLFEVVKK